MELTKDQAKTIRDTFGSCSVMYECMDLEDIVAEAKEYADLQRFLDFMLEMEEVHLEQRGNQWSGEDQEEFNKEVEQDKRFLQEMRQRVKEMKI